jgi:hypothetical protein
MAAVTLRVEAAAFEGTPVYFGTVGPWSRPGRMTTAPQSTMSRVLTTVTSAILAGVMIWAALLARQNMQRGRGDRRGATRVSLFVLAMGLAGWAVGARHSATIQVEMERVFRAAGEALFEAGLMWLLYMALEPYVRRIWPNALIAWTRALAGRVRDPLVARDVLVGVGLGALVNVTALVQVVGPAWVGLPPPPPMGTTLSALGSTRLLLGAVLALPGAAIVNAAIVVFMFVLIRVLLRRVWLASAVSVIVGVLLVGPETLQSENLAFTLATTLVIPVLVVGCAVRYGLLALVAMLFTNMLLWRVPPAWPTEWFAPMQIWTIGLAFLLALYGLYWSRAGEPLFGRRLIPE